MGCPNEAGHGHKVREEAASYGASMNDLVVAAPEKEVSMREQLLS